MVDEHGRQQALRTVPSSAVLPTFRRAAASRAVKPLSIRAEARFSLSEVTTGLRPPLRQRLAAAASPAPRAFANWLMLKLRPNSSRITDQIGIIPAPRGPPGNDTVPGVNSPVGSRRR